MIQRMQYVPLKKALSRSASVVLTGPRQVGKTTLANLLADDTAAVYLDLENPLDREKVADIVAMTRFLCNRELKLCH